MYTIHHLTFVESFALEHSLSSTPPQSSMETVFVGNLSYFCTETVLRNVFQPYGTVQSAIIRKTKANQTLFYGFVQMKTSQEAANAVANLDGCFVQGRHMK